MSFFKVIFSAKPDYRQAKSHRQTCFKINSSAMAGQIRLPAEFRRGGWTSFWPTRHRNCPPPREPRGEARHSVRAGLGQTQDGAHGVSRPAHSRFQNSKRTIPFGRRRQRDCLPHPVSGRMPETTGWKPVPPPAHHFGFNCGNRITSRILSWPSSIMHSRSMPMPMPPAGGMPCSSATRKSSSSFCCSPPA